MTSDPSRSPQKGSYAWQKQQYESHQRSEATRERVLTESREKERNPQQAREGTEKTKADKWLGFTPDENRGAATRNMPAHDRDRDRDIER